MEYRASTPIDAALDTANLLAAVAILFYLHVCTASSDTHPSLAGVRRWSRFSIIAISVIAGAAAVVVAFALRLKDYANLHGYCIATVALFAIALLITSILGAIHGRRFTVWLSIGLLILLSVSLILKPPQPEMTDAPVFDAPTDAASQQPGDVPPPSSSSSP